MSLQNIPDCLCRDWVWDDGVYVPGDLDSIGSLASGDMCDDGVRVSGRKLGRATKLRGLSIGKEILEYSGDGGLADTSFRGNIASGVTMGGQGEDVFLVGGRNGTHIRSSEPWAFSTA